MKRRAFIASLLGGAFAVMLPTPPQPAFKLTSAPVRMRPQKLRVRWTIESAAELREVYGVCHYDAADALRRRIDREIVRGLM